MAEWCNQQGTGVGLGKSKKGEGRIKEQCEEPKFTFEFLGFFYDELTFSFEFPGFFTRNPFFRSSFRNMSMRGPNFQFEFPRYFKDMKATEYVKESTRYESPPISDNDTFAGIEVIEVTEDKVIDAESEVLVEAEGIQVQLIEAEGVEVEDVVDEVKEETLVAVEVGHDKATHCRQCLVAVGGFLIYPTDG
ncbi:3-hydroxyacyl-[acyl-carrier-protein] dehydratase FabZ [Striga asiatica]|uniref:3-hydroxyacyl-[acyl-carrier-protein] dehydratase FabZ n=1 Tax=Striga asiatica TaxID=4170 RepID=A0A5A7QHV9_STRAF|nr:3-hydroxyacyl-[acyl-carrier-protein] dehydratase FabZ [Striga asiatica]